MKRGPISEGGGRTWSKETVSPTRREKPAPPTASLINPRTRILPLRSKTLQLKVEDLLVAKEGRAGGECRDGVVAVENESGESE